MHETKKPFRRLCRVFCGVEVDVEGGRVRIDSGYGALEAIAEASEEVGRETIALAVGWWNPLDPRGVREKGANVQRRSPDGALYDPVSGLARQSALAVNVARA